MNELTDNEIWLATIFAFVIGYVLVSFLARLMKTEPPEPSATAPGTAEPQPTIDDEAACAQLLGVAPNASPTELEQAYRDALAKNHPDNVAGLDEEFKRLAQQRIQEIETAYAALKKRREKT